MSDLVIELSEPITGHGGLVTEIVLRAPTWRELALYGEPFNLISSAAGNGEAPQYTRVDNQMAINRYIEALLKPAEAPAAKIDYGLLNQLCLRDALALKDAVLGFFYAARSTTSSAASNS
jgi:hypothetical protein